MTQESLEKFKERYWKERMSNKIYFDRQGNAMNLEELALKMETEGEEYRIIKQEYVGRYWISTVWVGINMNTFHPGLPLIFETMIFIDENSTIENDPLEGFQERYATEEEALFGHDAAKFLCVNQLALERDSEITQ